MDYEKAYKESFGVAQCLHEAGDTTTKKQMERLFPQLAESKDERIRKGLIWHLKADTDFVSNGVTKAECIAYLEKQKEPKPVVTHGETYRVDTLGTQQVIAGKMPQKPAEWSEEDENMAYFVNQFLEYHELSDPTAKSCKKWFNNRFKSLRNRVGKEFLQPHWKPSEEQMKALLKVVDKARELHYSSNSGYDEYDVLRLLYGQLKHLRG